MSLLAWMHSYLPTDDSFREHPALAGCVPLLEEIMCTDDPLAPLLLPELQMLVLMVGKMRVRSTEQLTCCCCGRLAAPAQHAQHVEHPDPSQCLRQVWELQDKALSAEPDAQGLVGGLQGVAAQLTTPAVLSALARAYWAALRRGEQQMSVAALPPAQMNTMRQDFKEELAYIHAAAFRGAVAQAADAPDSSPPLRAYADVAVARLRSPSLAAFSAATQLLSSSLNALAGVTADSVGAPTTLAGAEQPMPSRCADSIPRKAACAAAPDRSLCHATPGLPEQLRADVCRNLLRSLFFDTVRPSATAIWRIR